MRIIERTDKITTETTIPQSAGAKNFKPVVVERCAVCGEPVKIREPIFNKLAGSKCRCYEEKRRKEEEARQKAESEYKRKNAKANSLMDDKAKKSVFENLTIRNDNRRYIRAAENYCKHWNENYKANRGLLFYGGTGRGKTTLAFCIANRLADKGVNIKAMSVNAMIQRIKDSYRNNGENGETALKAEIKTTSLLVLDDLGAEYKTNWSACLLYEIIDERYRSGKPSIVTTNLSLKQLREHLTDTNGIPRAFDRLVESLTPVEFQCRNYRMEQAKTKTSEYNFFDIT